MDIDFTIENNRLNARASALIFNKDKTKILLCKIRNRDYYMLPGGRINFYEDSLTAIKREIKEEIGYNLDYQLIAIEENFITRDNIKITQYCFCYKAIYKENINNTKLISKDNNNQYFYWIDINELNNYNIVPKSTYQLIKDNNNIKHLIEKN